MMASPEAVWPVTILRNGSGIECLRYPVRDVAATKRHVVYADVFDAAGALVKQFELALRAVDQLLVGTMRVFNGNLPIPGAMRHQEGYAHPIQHSIECDL